MKNDSLNTQILLCLSRRKTGMSEKTLKAETVIGYDEDGAKIFKLFPEGNGVAG